MGDMTLLSDDALDALLMAQVKEREQKIAMVIVRAMKPYGEDWDRERVKQRIIALVEAGKVESFGNIRHWRYSEIRLPSAK